MLRIGSRGRLVVYFVVAFVLILILVFAQLSGNPQTVQAGSTITGALGLLFVLVQLVAQLLDNIQKDKKPSDLAITNALTELETAKRCLEEKQYQLAIDKTTSIIRILPKKGEAYQIRARANAALGKVHSALEDYQKAIELEPGFPFNYSGRAQLLRDIGDYSGAIRDYSKALAVAPELSGSVFPPLYPFQAA